ncbi:MAG: pilus assembly protein N-terminal domain-containing protein [Clostridia bacterium]|nr:pilus assembly protein N-terminal domain-containing protein [Clostridia bacterium]
MKKLISIILAVVMMLSFTVPAFAASETVSLGEVKTLSLKSGAYKRFNFAPDESALYSINAEMLNNGAAKISVSVDDVIVEEGSCINMDDEEDAIGVFNADIKFYAKSGSEVEITVSNEMGEYYGTAQVKFSVAKSDAKELKLGTNTTANGGSWFIFTPDQSGYYNFCSSSPKNIDPEIDLYSTEGYIDSSSDNGREYPDGSVDLNFDYTVYLEAGEPYALHVYALDEEFDVMDAQIKFDAAFNKEIKAEKLALEWMDDEDTIEMAVGNEYSNSILVVPTGAVPTTKVKVSVGDESIASIDYDEETQEIYITANKKGTTTLTISTDDGLSCTYKIKVQSAFILAIKEFFRNIPLLFAVMIDNLFGWMF